MYLNVETSIIEVDIELIMSTTPYLPKFLCNILHVTLAGRPHVDTMCYPTSTFSSQT